MIVLRVFSAVTTFTKWIAMAAAFAMMIIITIGVVTRFMGSPMVGNVELVELLQGVLIMMAFAYAQKDDKHIRIAIITEHFPMSVQRIINMIGYLATVAFCAICAYVLWFETLEYYYVNKEVTMVLEYPLYIFKFAMCAGFFAWGLETLNRIVVLAREMVPRKGEPEKESDA